MKKLLLITLTVFPATALFAQKTDSLSKERITYYSNQLNVNTKTAAKVEAIISAYKSEAKGLTDKNYDQKTLRAKFDSLIAVKNQKLSGILNKEQLVKVVTVTELAKASEVKSADAQTAKSLKP